MRKLKQSRRKKKNEILNRNLTGLVSVYGDGLLDGVNFGSVDILGGVMNIIIGILLMLSGHFWWGLAVIVLCN